MAHNIVNQLYFNKKEFLKKIKSIPELNKKKEVAYLVLPFSSSLPSGDETVLTMQRRKTFQGTVEPQREELGFSATNSLNTMNKSFPLSGLQFPLL